MGLGTSPSSGMRLRAFLHQGLRSNSRQQRLGIRMTGIAENFFAGGQFNQAAQIHDADAVRNVADHAEVMRNEQIGQSGVFLKADEQIDNLCLNGHVERRDGSSQTMNLGSTASARAMPTR